GGPDDRRCTGRAGRRPGVGAGRGRSPGTPGPARPDRCRAHAGSTRDAARRGRARDPPRPLRGTATMTILDSVTGPCRLAALSPADLETLAAEIREFLVAKVSRTGGHLGSNLGVVELTLALHRVF